MTEDARFEDGGEQPLYLQALDAEDLGILSALVQDSVFPGSEMSWSPKKRRFAVLLNRFRWEHEEQADQAPERVQSVLAVSDVLKVASQGVSPKDKETILSLLSLDFEAGEDGTGRLVMTFAGDGAVSLDVEALDVTLRDVTRPYRAVSGHRPDHKL